MTVQELIDRLTAVEDKTLPIVIKYGEFDDDIEAEAAGLSDWVVGRQQKPCVRIDVDWSMWPSPIILDNP